MPGPPGPDATVHAATRREAADALEQAFKTNGLVVQHRGEKFSFLLPAVASDHIAALFHSIPDPPADPVVSTAPQEMLPPGIIDFVEAETSQVLEIWQELTGRTVIRHGYFFGNKIALRTQNPMSRAQATWLLDAALRLAGVFVIPEGEKFAFAVPWARTNDLPRFDRAAALAKAVPPPPPPPPQTQQYPHIVVLDAQRLMGWYAPYTRRQALPLATNFPPLKFSARVQAPLDQAETIFLLEALAQLNGAAFELVGTNQFRLVPRPLPPAIPGRPQAAGP